MFYFMQEREQTGSAGTGPRSNEAGTFEDLALCHLDLVYRVAHKFAGNPNEAEDLVQETFLRAHKAFGRFELRESGAKPWLLKILHNAFLSKCRRDAKAPAIMPDMSFDNFAAELREDPLPVLAEGDATVNWENFDEELKRAVESLTPEYRAVIVLWALEDLSYKEIAQVLGCALGTVMSRLHRARGQLVQTLGDYATERGFR